MSLALDIETSVAFALHRATKTTAAQVTVAATWMWDAKNSSEWAADLAQTDGGVPGTLAYFANRDHVLYVNARGPLTARYADMKARTLQAVKLMRGRALRDRNLAPAVDELSAKGNTWTTIESEAEDCLAVWTTTFGGAAYTPVATNTYAKFKALFEGAPAVPGVPGVPAVPAVPSLRALKTPYHDALAVARVSVGRYNALISRLEDDSVQWYGDATAVFLAGTPEGDMIRSTVPTSDDYNPATSGPAAPGVSKPTVTAAMAAGSITLTIEATGTTLFNIYEKAPASDAYMPVATGVESGWSKALTTGSGEWLYKVAGTLLGEEGPMSDPVSQTV